MNLYHCLLLTPLPAYLSEHLLPSPVNAELLHILARTSQCVIHLTYVLALPPSYIGTSHKDYRKHLNDVFEI